MPVTRRKPRARLLSALGVALLATLALGAGTAQAHEWIIKGTPLSKLGGKTGITGKSSESIFFRWAAVEESLNWSCKTATESGTAETGGVSQATIQFSGCAFVKEHEPCHISSVNETTVSTKVVEVMSEGKLKTYEVYSTLPGKPLKVQVLGATCILAPQTWEFSGSFASPLDGLERIAQPRTFSKVNQLQSGSLLGPASGPLYIEGGWSETLALGGLWLLN